MAAVESYLMDYVILRQQFSESGGVQFQRDIQELWSILRTWLTDIDGVLRKYEHTFSFVLIRKLNTQWLMIFTLNLD